MEEWRITEKKETDKEREREREGRNHTDGTGEIIRL